MKYKQEKVKEHVRTSRTDWGSPTAEQGTARRHNDELDDDKIMALQNVNQSMHRAKTRSSDSVRPGLSYLVHTFSGSKLQNIRQLVPCLGTVLCGY
jgi:hypothetical protein